MDTMTTDRDAEAVLRDKYDDLRPHLDERSFRLVMDADTIQYGLAAGDMIARAANVPVQTVLDGAAEVNRPR